MTALKVSQRIRDMLAEWATNAPAMAEDFRAGHLDWSHLPQMLAHFEAETLERAAKVADERAKLAQERMARCIEKGDGDNAMDCSCEAGEAMSIAHAIRAMIGRDG